MGEDGFGLDRIGQIAVPVDDLDRAVAFYRDLLGMRLLFAVPGMAFFGCGEVRLMLTLPESDEFDHPGSIIYYRVDDLASAHAVLAERGVAFRKGPELVHRADDHELWMAFFHDPAGNTLALMAEKPLDA